MGEKIVLRACFVRIHGIIENCLEVGRSRVSVIHKRDWGDSGIVGNEERQERHTPPTCK